MASIVAHEGVSSLRKVSPPSRRRKMHGSPEDRSFVGALSRALIERRFGIVDSDTEGSDDDEAGWETGGATSGWADETSEWLHVQ